MAERAVRRRPRAIRVVAAVALLMLVLAGCSDGSPVDPQPTTPPEVALPPAADPLPLEDIEAFSSVVMLNAGSNCTGTLIDTRVPAGPAYVLTNGHCVGDVGRSAQSTTVSEEWWGTAEFLRAEGNEENTLEIAVTQLAYSTMRHTDTAIVRLDATLDELAGYGITPVPIVDGEPAPGDAVVNVGVPVQELAPDDWMLRRGACTLGEQHTLIEFAWLWFGVWANDCPGIVQGSSGSPLLRLTADGTPQAIVGMINTTSWGTSKAAGGACSMSRPCQVTAEGPVMVEETSYAQSVAGIGRCFDDAGVFTLGEDCPLPRSSVWSETTGGAFRGGDLENAAGVLPVASFVGTQAGTVRTTLVPLDDATACTAEEAYAGVAAQPLPAAGEPWESVGTRTPVDLPDVEGWFLQCAVNGTDYAGAAAVLFSVDRTPPLFAAGAEVEDLGAGSVLVRPHLNPPEITTVRFTWGPQDTVDCSAAADFQDFFIVPLLLEQADLPARYCVYGLDEAGNRTPTETIDIPSP